MTQVFFFFGRQFALVAFGVGDFVLFVVKPLLVYGDFGRFGRRARADNALELDELLPVDVGQLEQLVVVKISVVETVANGAFGVNALNVLQKFGGVEFVTLSPSTQ